MRGAMTGGLRAQGGEEAQHKCGNSKPRTGRHGRRRPKIFLIASF